VEGRLTLVLALLVQAVLQAAFIVLIPPLLIGVIAKTKALFGGRRGPPLLQAYYDIAKLLRKGSVFSRTTTWVFLAGPVVAVTTALIAALLVPIGGGPALLHFTGDFVVLAYLLGLSRFFTMAAALDTGSAFEGMGAAREATFACLAEPALFLGFLALVKATGSTSLSGFLGPGLVDAWASTGASMVLVAAGLFIVLLAENSRIPVDDPNTHLELTMIHEVMVLDHGGPALGLILYGAAVKLMLFAVLFVRLLVPGLSSGWVAWSADLAAVLGVAVLVGIVESTMARLRLTHIPSFLVAACLLCAFGLIMLVR
jgi:formate hydrogenlyase subunit 4